MIDTEKQFGIVTIGLPTPFPVGPANVFLIKADPPILVDAGIRTDEAYDALIDGMTAQGYAPRDLGAIIATHGHRDHIGLLGRLLQESDAKAYGHPRVAALGKVDTDHGKARKDFYLGIMAEFGVPEETQDEANALYDNFKAFSEPFELDHEFEDGGEALDFRIAFVPGHSPSDTLLIHTSKAYTFVGDHILATTNPNPLLRRFAPGETRAKALVEFRDSLRRSRVLAVDGELGVCFPGHGDPFDNPVEVIDGILKVQDRRMQQVRELVESGVDTPYLVSRQLFPKLPMRNIHLGLSIAVGHMEVLEEEGILQGNHDEGILRFRSKVG